MRKKSKMVTRAIIALGVLLVAAIAVIIVGKMELDKKAEEIDGLVSEMTQNRKMVYVAATGVEKGELLELDVNVMKQEIYTGLEIERYITEEQLGQIAVVDIEEGDPVMQSMVTPLKIQKDTREYEMQVVNLMTDQTENDVVDIRIMFPNGEDYTILSKKSVKNLFLDNCVFFSYLNEEEIVRMASATVDAFMISGTRIYATRYVEENLQEESKPNYLVRQETIDLINTDPNILTKAQETLNVIARTDLERRLGTLTEDQLAAVASGHNLQDTAKSAVLTTLYSENAELAEDATQGLEENGEERNTEEITENIEPPTEEPQTEREAVGN